MIQGFLYILFPYIVAECQNEMNTPQVVFGVRTEKQSYTNKHKLPHSHDSTGMGGHGVRASDLWVNVTLPVYTSGQDIYLFWLRRRVCVCTCGDVTHSHMPAHRN